MYLYGYICVCKHVCVCMCVCVCACACVCVCVCMNQSLSVAGNFKNTLYYSVLINVTVVFNKCCIRVQENHLHNIAYNITDLAVVDLIAITNLAFIKGWW